MVAALAPHGLHKLQMLAIALLVLAVVAVEIQLLEVQELSVREVTVEVAIRCSHMLRVEVEEQVVLVETRRRPQVQTQGLSVVQVVLEYRQAFQVSRGTTAAAAEEVFTAPRALAGLEVPLV
jgi:ABC-type anion transport system duplicated permease subunit